MSLPEENILTLEQYYERRAETNERLEYIDGLVFMTPSPSTQHQRISGRLHAKLFHFLEGTDCEVFHAPFDIELQNEQSDGKKIVIPDLSVICDKNGLLEDKYVGAPSLIIEILSPSNQAHDLVFKLNLYMQCGVKEYWIVNPMLQTVQVYTMETERQYSQKDVLKERGTVRSSVLAGFEVKVEEIF